jgi:hypothetical protein
MSLCPGIFRAQRRAVDFQAEANLLLEEFKQSVLHTASRGPVHQNHLGTQHDKIYL